MEQLTTATSPDYRGDEPRRCVYRVGGEQCTSIFRHFERRTRCCLMHREAWKNLSKEKKAELINSAEGGA